MTVNVNSQISTTINTWNPSLYDQITNMENYCYTLPVSSTTPSEADYQVEFKSLSDAIVGWMQSDWYKFLKDFIPQLYTYKMMVDMYGCDGSQLSNADANSIFTCNGYISHIMAQTVDYYADGTTSTDATTGTTTTSFPHLDADISTVQGAYTADSGRFSTVESNMQGITGGKMNDLLFNNITPNPSLDKNGMANYIFNTLHYKPIYQNFAVSPLTLPASVS